MTAGDDRRGRTSLSGYYNATHLRADAWSRLKNNARRLQDAHHRGRDTEDLEQRVWRDLELLRPIEAYWAFPGKRLFAGLLDAASGGNHELLGRSIARIVRLLSSDAYRRSGGAPRGGVRDFEQEIEDLEALPAPVEESKPYFELLVVDELTEEEEEEIRERMHAMRRREDDFLYEVVVVSSFEDALIAVLFNHNVQACVVRYGFPYAAANHLEILQRYVSVAGLNEGELVAMDETERSLALGRVLHKLRPELDLYLVTEAPVEEIAGTGSRDYRRVFYRQEDYRELHLSILKGIHARYDTPFFNALKSYTQKPTGVFHAMPISRGKSIAKSHWIQDMRAFYGDNVFLAETSATTGGLDSLLQAKGSLKRAMESAARAFGARRTFFVTNGTSTANKIALQAICRPGDIVLVSHDCHISHHYSTLLSGAFPLYMDPYPVSEYSMYGAVSIAEIKRTLLALRAEGKLERVKCLLLTNCTFDGITYDPLRVMREVLAIKPDVIFLWDEAWFAFARFSPVSRRRTAMDAATRLAARLADPAYRDRYATWRAALEKRGTSDADLVANDLLPDPAAARVRVYATQSTHKTLTALRQGSMIHVFDQDFERRMAGPFHEAYMTHTSTSPNYQILASLDVGRRQVEFEGYEMVQKSVDLAMTLRERVRADALLSRHFRVLGPGDLIPREFRRSGIEAYYDPEAGWTRMEDAWGGDEFALDPTRVTLACGLSGLDGASFKEVLMDRFDIQINKTSRNTVLFMIHIGMTRGTVAYLIDTLTRIATDLEERDRTESSEDKSLHASRVAALTRELPPLPNFSRFHDVFRPDPEGTTLEGDMRAAFFAAYDEEACEHMRLDGTVAAALDAGRVVVSATFVTPYPPGFPVLVPGQVISREILDYLRALDVKEIHGYDPVHGLRVFTESTLHRLAAAHAVEASPYPPDMTPAKKRTSKTKSAAAPRRKKKLKGLSDIRRFFHRNEEPVYFVSATNFNLLGLDEWVGHFKFVNYIDCFDGHHPHVFSPPEMPHDQFESIEDINNYLLRHPDVQNLIHAGNHPARAVFLMFDEETERLAKELDVQVCFPPARLREAVDDKINATRIGNRAGVPSVPNALAKVTSWAELKKAAKGLGRDWVIQTAFGDSGHTTFFIKSERDWKKHAEEIAEAPEVKIMKRIDCRQTAIEACVTRHGTIVGPLMTELVGFKELTPYKGGWCGNEVFADAFDQAMRTKARKMTFKFGEELRKMGYRGYFELDLLQDKKTGELYLGEVNPRITGASSMTNLAAFAHADAPLFLFHLLEYMGVSYDLDVDALNKRWADPANIDSWSQLVIKHTDDDVRMISQAPRTGIYEIDSEGRMHFLRVQTHRRTVQSGARAFFLRIAKEGDYLYEGADVGILVVRGRLMDDRFRLTRRAKAWINAVRSEYTSRSLKGRDAEAAEHRAEVGGFKLL